MVVTDPIADFIIRLKNAYLARRGEVRMPYSKLKEELAKILEKEKFIKNFKVEGGKKEVKKELLVDLRYKPGKEPAITQVKRFSKPGLRVYAKYHQLPRVKFGYGITIISTSQGLMTDYQAFKKRLGGEVFCQVW